jgi:pimeloyl-ACP methyl ester carboxylesterase
VTRLDEARPHPESAPALVLVHAFGSSGRAWAPQVQGLGGRRRVVTPDLPGHGPAEGPFTLDRAVASVCAAIDGAGGPAHLTGISGGAVVALLTCLEHQPKVRSLVLSAGIARPPRWFALQRALTQVTPEPLLARMLVRTYSGGRAEHAQAAAEDFRRCGKATFVRGLRELAGVDLRGRLGEVGVPTLVLCGSRDRANIPLSEDLAAGIPGAELRIVRDATHLWNLQQPQVFNEMIAAFVDRAEVR